LKKFKDVNREQQYEGHADRQGEEEVDRE